MPVAGRQQVVDAPERDRGGGDAEQRRRRRRGAAGPWNASVSSVVTAASRGIGASSTSLFDGGSHRQPSSAGRAASQQFQTRQLVTGRAEIRGRLVALDGKLKKPSTSGTTDCVQSSDGGDASGRHSVRRRNLLDRRRRHRR